MFQTWASVPTATISFQDAGAITGVSDGNVSTAAEFNAVFGSCVAGTQSPIVFDANGSILSALGIDPLVIGFSSQCKISSTGFIVSDLVLLNGAFQNGFTQPQITANQFDEAITHELGHLLGLDHSQINLNLFQSFSCPTDGRAGLPLMFPVLFCPARVDSGLPKLSPDDTAWISKLYPSASFATAYATISGTVFFSDGEDGAQDVNVIARQVNDAGTPQDESQRVAVSVVSGYRFTGNPGQSVTANYLPCNPPGSNGCPASGFLSDNSGGSQFGSRNPALAGSFDIPVPAGASYTLEIEAIDSEFTGGSSVGPLESPFALPGVAEFWDSNESASDDPTAKTAIPTAPGEQINDKNIILNGTPPKFDSNEDSGAELMYPQLMPWLREEEAESLGRPA
jgi:hypothetical protein